MPNNFIGEISKVFNWQFERDNTNAVPGEYIFDKIIFAKIYSDCNTKLKYIRSDDKNKITFAHLNINSNRSKFEFLTEKAKGKIDIFMSL